jgi:hypothetical protein
LFIQVENIDSLSFEQIQKQFSRIISEGLLAANDIAYMPFKECEIALECFESIGFRNRWVHVDKTWPRWSCRCVIAAELTIDKFELDQVIYSSGQLIARHRIAETKPREGIFVDYLGDLSMSAEGIITYRKKTKVMTMFDIREGVFIEQ